MNYLAQQHIENIRRALIPAETDTGATRRLYEIQKQQREHAEAEAA